MKVALCFIVSYEHIIHKEQLWIDWIQPNQDIINIYFHYKDFNKIKSSWIKKHSIPSKFIKHTSYFNVVPAYISLLNYAFYHDYDNHWFCLLTESCVPIISPYKFRKMFMQYYFSSIIRCKPAYWNITLHRRANLQHLHTQFWLANDPWFTLCRDHVFKCLLFTHKHRNTFELINAGGLANESLFAIILQTFNELTNNHTFINSSSNICDWTRMTSPTSPYLFKEHNTDNFNVIIKLLKENKHAIFLRKVHQDFPDSIIHNIMEIDFHPIIETHTHYYFTFTYFFTFLYNFLIPSIVPIFFTIFFTKRFMNSHFFT